MSALKSVNFGFGTVGYTGEKPEIPETRQVIDDNTHIHMGSPARAAHYDVSYTFSCEYEGEDNPLFNIFALTVRLTGKSGDAPYSEVESEAARQIAPMLRAVADSVEKQVSEFDASRREERGES